VTSVEPELRRRGLPVTQEVGSRTFLAWCLAEAGEFAEAMSHAEHAVRRAEGLGSAYALVHACSGTAMVHLRNGAFADAIAAAERAVELCRGRDFSALWAMPAAVLGAAYTSVGRVEEAIELLQRAADAVSVLASPILGFLGEAYLGSRRVHDALTVGTRALELATAHGERGWEAWSLRLLGDVLARDEAPRIEAAEEMYRRAVALAQDLGMRPLLGRCHLGLGALYREAGTQREAIEHCETALSLFRDTGMPYWLQQTEKVRALAGHPRVGHESGDSH
jgi:tetratricopeptide (TPR) repeat protein